MLFFLSFSENLQPDSMTSLDKLSEEIIKTTTTTITTTTTTTTTTITTTTTSDETASTTLPVPLLDDFSKSHVELLKYCIEPKGQNPYDLDCHKYVDCGDTEVFLRNCHPPNLVFDPITSKCKWSGEPGMAERCKNFNVFFFSFLNFLKNLVTCASMKNIKGPSIC